MPVSLVNLNHFRLLRVVGKGAFGKVRIVERKDTGLTFALKYIRKDESRWLSAKTACDHLADPHFCCSRSIGERAQHYTRAENVGATQSSFPLQLTVQLSRYRIFVCQ